MAFDPKKPVQTRDGRKARIIATDLKDVQPIVAIVAAPDGSETVEQYDSDGRFLPRDKTSGFDLVNLKVKKTAWVNLYPKLGVTCYPTESAANHAAGDDRIACVQITYEDYE